MLNWNAQKVKNLTASELWMFIIARVLIGFGAGALLCKYYPQLADPIAIPVLAVGVVLFLVAMKGFGRKISN
jgi:peptidoglycan/LPS O-acetylase OafA/YrhL